MQTNFTPNRLKDPQMAQSNKILQNCVHCGLCTGTCPTYQITGDELDSPRGRIYLIKEMFENNRPADEKTAHHIDRCLSCLSCATTCPAGVDYMHLLDHARAHIEQTYKRPFSQRAVRWMLALVLPRPGLMRVALWAARQAKAIRPLTPPQLRRLIDYAPNTRPPYPSGEEKRHLHKPIGPKKMRVALLTGCAQKVLSPQINEASIRVLTRAGAEVVIPPQAGCCGALTHHMGKTKLSHASAARNIRAYAAAIEDGGLDAIVINTSGCGTTVKDYGHMFQNHPELAQDAARVSALTMDISEVLARLTLPFAEQERFGDVRVAYHAACSLQHGQNVREAPKELLRAAGMQVLEPAESHLCCGSAGVYNLTQPHMADELKARKLQNLEAQKPDVIAAGNIGCITQLESGPTPIAHLVELLDWASGGPKPMSMR